MSQYISPFFIDYSARTDIGVKPQKRGKKNEDTIFTTQGFGLIQGVYPLQWSLFVVADGMGGHTNGKEASELATNALMEHVTALIATKDGQVITQDFAGLLVEGVEKANDAVCNWNEANNWDGGTTMAAALIVGDMAFVANVGDSRTYLYRSGEGITQISEDHSLVASLVKAGVIQPDDVYTHPRRNQIWRSLGEKRDVKVDVFSLPLQRDDKLLLCSDGLWEMVRNDQIENVLASQRNPHMVTQQLIEAANANGGHDNISAIVAVVYAALLPVPALQSATPSAATTFTPPVLASTIVKNILIPLVALWGIWCGWLMDRALPKIEASVLAWMEPWIDVQEDDSQSSIPSFTVIHEPSGNAQIVHFLPSQPTKQAEAA
jgi:serine/threonine protein phosphatase PrpC